MSFASGALALALALGPAAGGPPAWSGTRGPHVTVVVSQEGPAYQEALDAFRHALDREAPGIEYTVIRLGGDSAQARLLASVPDDSASLVFALGTLAARASLQRFHASPIVAGMIVSAAELSGSANATGVVLQFPVETELEWLRRVLPQQRRVGVIYHSDANRQRVTVAERVGAPLRLAVQAYRVDGPDEIPDALEGLATRADVIWSLTDPVVFNQETAKVLLLYSLRRRIPLVGLSAPWVRAGALYALDRDYGDIGVQCAELAVKIMNGRPVSSLPPVPPRKVRWIVNRSAAEQLHVALSVALLEQAAEVVP